MQGLQSFNIVLVGTNFSTQHVQLEDFDFGGLQLEVELRLPQALQATAAEYSLQILPGRFQVGAQASQPSAARVATLMRVSSAFAEGYTTKRSIIAVGHNFSGDVSTSFETATDFMKYVAWREDFAAAMGPDPDPTLSLTTRTRIGEGRARTIRLEPLALDNTKLFYDLNFNWGEAEKSIQIPVSEALESFPESVKLGTELIERILSLGSSNEGEER